MIRAAVLLLVAVAAVPHRRLADGQEWTTSNVDVAMDRSYCYDNDPANCRKYGRLYEWDAAGRACAALGDRWRLPTKEEWAALTRAYGALLEEDKVRSQEAFKAMRPGGRAGFDLALGGGRNLDGSYARVDAHGFYWTATETDAGHAWMMNIGRGLGAVNRHANGEKKDAYAVRCVRDSAAAK
ncbi:MAG: hypothetical protein IT162_11680 [Bryobacterales bacterium]|nr:hypothetical protein [Bryobacterales bacterium]